MQNQVIEEIAKHLGITVADIDPNASLAEDLGLGPIELADLLSAISAKFNITFDSTDVTELHLVNDIIEAVEDKSIE